MKSFEEIKKNNWGYIDYNGKRYYFLAPAYADNYQNDIAIFANAVTGETDEFFGELIQYKIRWAYTGAENSEDWADWENPIEITKQ